MAHSVIFLVSILCLSQCYGVIYNLNESEYSRMPPLFSLDEYSSCLEEEHGVYCMLELQLHEGRNHTLMEMIWEYSKFEVKHYNHSVLSRGVCVRKTCGKYVHTQDAAEDLARSLEACLNESMWREYGLEATLSSMLYCDRHNEPVHINKLDWIVLWAILALVALSIVGSCYDYFIHLNNGTEKLKGNKYLLCFSVMRNWRCLTDADITHDVTNEKTRHLTSLHGVRSIACVIVILPHAYLLVAAGFTENTLDYEKTYDSPLYHVMYNGMSVVQIFFFISGFLMVYNLYYIEKKRKLNVWDIPKILLFRIVRALPVLLLVLALSATWVRHAGSGPLWKLFVTGSLVADCQQYWWHTLLFISNYMPGNRHCIIPTWHLSAEIQVFTMGVATYVLAGARRAWALRCLLVLGTLAPAAHVLLQDLDAIVIMKPEFYRTLINPTFRFLHILGHNNLSCLVIGMFTALSLHRWYNNGCKMSNSLLVSSIPYAIIASVILIFYSGRVFYSEGPRPSLLFRMAYAAAVRPMVGLACSIFLLGTVRGNSGVRRVLAWRGWVAPSKLSYAVFLLHMPLVHVALAARAGLTQVAFSHVAQFHLLLTITTFLAAVPVYLLVEAPFDRLLRVVRDQFTDISSHTTSNKPVEKSN